MGKQYRSGYKFLSPLNLFKLLLATMLLSLASCGGGSGSSSSSQTTIDPAILAGAMTGSFSDASISAAVSALQQSGVTVANNDGIVAAAVTTSGGLSVLEFQARGMAQEVFNKDGFSGASVDRMTPPIPLPDGVHSITVSMLLAAYVKTADTNGAKVARGLMGDIDTAKHADYIYPTIVVMSFLQEVAVPMLAEMELENGPAAAAPAVAAIVAAFSASDPCGSINEFLNDLPTTVTRAINSISPESSSLWRSIVSVAAVVGGVATGLAVDAAKAMVRHIPAVTAVRNGMTVVHAASDVKSLLTHWEVKVTGTPGNLHKNPGSPTAGTFTVSLSNGGPTLPDWPQAVKSCAELLAIPLPDFNNPAATVTWKPIAGFDDLAIESSREGALANSQAKFNFNTATESQSVHDNPGSLLTTGTATVEAKVSMPGLESLLQALAPTIGGTAGRIVSGAAAPAAQEMGLVKSGSVPIKYHTPQIARINFDGTTERLIVESPDGMSPDGSWSGIFASNLIVGQCGGWVEVPVSWTFNGGTATLVPCNIIYFAS